MPDSRLSARSLAHMLGEWRAEGSAYRELADAVRVLCLDRRIVTGTRLPAERELATTLALSRTTVAAAYASLRETGHIESVRGSGSVVRFSPTRVTSLTALPPAGAESRPVLDLQQASPDAWPGVGSLFAEAAADIGALVARPGYDIFGSPELRASIAARYTAFGLPTSSEQIIVTTGAQHAISLVASAIVRRGDRVAIETPTYPHAAETLRRVGARLVPIPVATREGWDLERAEHVVARGAPTLAYLMPDFQNPTGCSMSAQTRRFFADAAQAGGTKLLVDETTAELDIDRPDRWEPFGVGLDERARSNVITVGSLGKTVWGGLRVGWIRADEDILHRILARRPSFDLGTPEMEQRVAWAAIQRMPEILRQRAAYLRAGRDAVLSAVRDVLPEWDVPSVHGGVSLWAGLGAPVSSRLVLAARARGVLLSSGTRFGVDGGHERRLRLPFTSRPEALDHAVRTLAAAWRDLPPGHAVPDDGLVAVV